MPTIGLSKTPLCLSLTSQGPKIHFSLSTNSFLYSFRPNKFHFLKPCSSLKETKKKQQTISKSPTKRLLNLNLKKDDENETTESDADNAVKGTILAGLLLLGVVGGFGGIGVIKDPRSLPLHSTSTPAQTVHEQVQQMPLNSTPFASQAVREQLQHSTSAGGSLPLHSTSAPAQTVHEQVQQIPLNSTSLASQPVCKQLQQLPLDSNPRTSQTVQEQVEDSSNHETNEQSEEQGPSAEKRKRGKTQMQSVHGRKGCKQIVLNENNQPIGPTNDDVNELGSFLGTLARTATFCPLNVFDWRKLETKEDMWKYVKV
ncbi:hypothetical protein A4A49_01950 [Nicotiana attenuata]|uniref:Uncharacterized protein n=1 Tax=Nicotiana attenuata TaxID=49451 RepID=A0A1J6JBS1_NICAT|nr:hypothetical protein A4A49_01950 [Nicotiana attenuata]